MRAGSAAGQPLSDISVHVAVGFEAAGLRNLYRPQNCPFSKCSTVFCPPPACRLPGEPGPANPQEERFLAFGRVFAGVVRQGQTVQVGADRMQQGATVQACAVCAPGACEYHQYAWVQQGWKNNIMELEKCCLPGKT